MKRSLAVLIVVLLAGCCARDDLKPLTEEDIVGRVLLEAYAIDLTWGYRLHGMYIVGDGTVWSYDYEGPPWYPEKLKPGELTAKDMLAKHRNAKQIGVVDRKGLLDMAQMIGPAGRGDIVRTSPNHEGGGWLDLAYGYDKSSKTYREIILSGGGDRAASNSAAAAAMLVDYLREVEQAVGWTW